ncbi:MAG: peptidylprolyl isomerase [Cohnella sp.]|nr:peptidylprolyl isomerase [Cohnella sp.]
MLHHKRTSIRRVLVLTLAAVLLAVMVSACGKKNEAKGDQLPGAGQGKVVASYNGGEVTQGEFDKYMAFMEVSDPQTAMYSQIPQFQEQFVKQLAVYKVFDARATDKQKQDADKDVATFEKQFNDAVKKQPTLQDQLTQKKLTVDEMKKIVKVLSSANQIVKVKQSEITAGIKDADIKAVFDKSPSDYNIATVRHILITTSDPQTGQPKRSDAEALKLAKEVKDKLEKGGDWKTLAKQYSEDPGSKDNGGLYEKQQVKGWVAEFKDAVNKQEIGKIGDPVKVSYGYHVIKVESRTAVTYDKLDQATKDKIKQDIVNNKLQTYMQDEQQKLNIKVTLPAPPVPSPSASAPASSSSVPSASPSSSASK